MPEDSQELYHIPDKTIMLPKHCRDLIGLKCLNGIGVCSLLSDLKIISKYRPTAIMDDTFGRLQGLS